MPYLSGNFAVFHEVHVVRAVRKVRDREKAYNRNNRSSVLSVDITLLFGVSIVDKLLQQVGIASRRLAMQRFLRVLPWCLCAALAVATIALAVPKFRPIQFDNQSWTMGWLVAAAVAGLIAAMIWVWVSRVRSLDAAVEIDRRFGLKERVSSTLALNDVDVATPAGQALVHDALNRVEGLDVGAKFGLKFGWPHLLPVATLALALVIAYVVPSATGDPASKAQAAAVTQNKPVRKTGEGLKKRFAKRTQEADKADLEEAKQLFSELERSAEKMASRKDSDRKKGLVELNNMASELKRRREEIGGREALRAKLKQLKDISRGPADRMADAIKKGDFGVAKSELQKLRDKIAKAGLDDQQQKELQKQLDQLADRMQKMAKQQAETAQRMQDEIDQLAKSGELAKAGQLQKQLDRLKSGDQQLERMAKLAQEMGECSKCLREGDSLKAAEALDGLMAQLDALDTEMSEMEMLEEALDSIADAKDSLNCKSCQGAGCAQCQGQGFGEGEISGLGLGEGQGVGDRPEEQTDTDFYESQVRGKPGRGKAVVVGTVGGPNQSGDALQEIRSAIESSKSDTADPLTGQRLPRAHRESVQQYFDAFRQGE